MVALDLQATRHAITNFLDYAPRQHCKAVSNHRPDGPQAWYESNKGKGVLKMVLSDGDSTMWAGGVIGVVHVLQGVHNNSLLQLLARDLWEHSGQAAVVIIAFKHVSSCPSLKGQPGQPVHPGRE